MRDLTRSEKQTLIDTFANGARLAAIPIGSDTRELIADLVAEGLAYQKTEMAHWSASHYMTEAGIAWAYENNLVVDDFAKATDAKFAPAPAVEVTTAEAIEILNECDEDIPAAANTDYQDTQWAANLGEIIATAVTETKAQLAKDAAKLSSKSAEHVKIYTRIILEAQLAVAVHQARERWHRDAVAGMVLTVTEAAQKAMVNRSYIKAEIEAGRLPAVKVGNQYQIKNSDFTAWMSNPRRGSRSSK